MTVLAAPPRPEPDADDAPGPRLAALPTSSERVAVSDVSLPPTSGRPGRLLGRRIAAVRKLQGVRRRATWRQRLVEAERGLVLGFRRDGVLAGHVFVLTLAIAAGVVFELNTSRWCVIFLALSGAMAAELFGQVIAALAAAVVRDEEADSELTAQVTGAVRLCSAAVAVAACGAAAALVAVFTPAVVQALGG
ncbi:diacylglycerol kinase [Alienimonas chondri]|uniref:diacylglycerol kinase n=1 Tax=Alienimonas chondri TaxID=2681879 RepID=UPI0014894238|nr:diacylglycerol kinase [Alienimonas chondri]